jgi:hypothetical protein
MGGFGMNPSMSEMEKRNILSEVALDNIPPNSVITNNILFNFFSKELLRGESILIRDGFIYS